jgi:hypothetical protein
MSEQPKYLTTQLFFSIVMLFIVFMGWTFVRLNQVEAISFDAITSFEKQIDEIQRTQQNTLILLERVSTQQQNNTDLLRKIANELNIK